MDALHDLELLIRSRSPILAVESFEEERVLALLMRLAERLRLPLYRWTLTGGLVHTGTNGALYDTREPVKALDSVASIEKPALYLLADLAPYLDQPEVARRLRELVGSLRRRGGTIVLTAPRLDLPPVLQKVCSRFVLALPDQQELEALVRHMVQDFGGGVRSTMELDAAELARLVDDLKGLTLLEAQRTLGKALADDHALTRDDLEAIRETKRELLREAGALEYVANPDSLDEIGGLENLKAWLRKRRNALTAEARAFGVPPPKGVILLGVQGCGKSLAARAVATDWDLPLLRLEPGRLYDKYIGESDKHLERALEAADRMAPCVLMIDEIEKGFAAFGSSEADGGLSRRIFGRLLGWLQDRTSSVFVIATCNDVSQLPPELVRKGRFDEIFFIDLPTAGDRRQIFEVHLRARERDPAAFDLDALAQAAEGFSGAEIEQVVVSGLYTAFATETALTTEVLLDEIAATNPLSVTRSEEVERLREWARGRAVPAGGSDA